MSELIVRSGGLSTTVQDAGRDGYYDIGLPPSGAMDQYSYAVANLLVGNPDGAAVLEATYIGPEVEFTDDRVVAVTGASAPVTVNGEPVEQWRAVPVRAGDVLGFGMLTAGARLYVAVSGGIAIPAYLGSRSTYTLTGIGGSKLAEGDRLPLGDDPGAARVAAVVPEDLRPVLTSEAQVRAVVGLCSYRLTAEALRSFLDTSWKVTKDADRVGYRLRGGRLDFVEREQPAGAGSDPANVVDLGYPLGSVQVPGGDEPIVLLNDAVTAGGYATIATVISVDRDVFGQARTGDRVRFRPVDLQAALAARRRRRDRLDRVRAALAS
ncbi:biotin-dependent carboxyltransferase family protein [Saccharopolyspora rosea]|uniref:Biotin-dependent carboxyltransferase family protein n=1 Tax=Saccharopolyspora rosea TaxID=524884 RepID=A0ABW3FVL4_9PSEU